MLHFETIWFLRGFKKFYRKFVLVVEIIVQLYKSITVDEILKYRSKEKIISD